MVVYYKVTYSSLITVLSKCFVKNIDIELRYSIGAVNGTAVRTYDLKIFELDIGLARSTRYIGCKCENI